MKTFFSKIKAWLEKVLGSSASWEKTASATLTVVAPLVETIVTLTAGEPAALAIAAIVGQVQGDMAAVATTITSAGPTPTITSILNAITSNLKSLLTSGDIKDATTLTKVESVVTTVAGEVEAILSVA